MKTFKITVEELYNKTVTVKAENVKAARSLVKEMGYSNEYKMTPDDYVGDSFNIVRVKQVNTIMNYNVTITAMQEHITDKSHLNETFVDFNKAYALFQSLCDRNDIEYREMTNVENERDLSAGGIGSDYRIELTITSQ